LRRFLKKGFLSWVWGRGRSLFPGEKGRRKGTSFRIREAGFFEERMV